MAWKDKHIVYYLSTATPLMRKNHRASPGDGGMAQSSWLPTVAAYAQYNGVNKLDQMMRQNKSKKCTKWYWRVETKLIETSLYNACHRRTHHWSQGWKCCEAWFFIIQAHKLVEGHYVKKAPVGRPGTEANDNDPSLDQMDHWPVRGEGKDHVCEMCNARHKHHKWRNPGISYQDNPFKQQKNNHEMQKV